MTIEANILAWSAAAATGALGEIFYFVVLPILLLAGAGYVMQRTLGLDMPTLTRLNFHFVIPAMVYFSVVTSTLAGEQVLAVVLYGVLMLVGMAGVTLAAALVRRVPREQVSAMLMTTIFNNSGNYGLPLQDLAFRPVGLGARATGMQVFVMVVQNLAGFTLGIFLAASGGRRRGHWRANLLHVAKFPPIYALAAALLTVGARSWMGESASAAAAGRLLPVWQVVVYAKDAFLAVAICTLGAQLALVARGPEAGKYPVTLSVFLRLLVGPAVALAIIYAMGLDGLIAQVLLISSSTPTAVNCMLMCLAFDNHPDYAARTVFYSTLLSPITVTLVIFLAQSGLLPRFAM